MMSDLFQIHSLIEDLDHQVDLLVKNQAKSPSVEGDKKIAYLLDQIDFLTKTKRLISAAGKQPDEPVKKPHGSGLS